MAILYNYITYTKRGLLSKESGFTSSDHFSVSELLQAKRPSAGKTA